MRAEEIGFENAKAEKARNLDGYHLGGLIEIATKSDAINFADALEKAIIRHSGIATQFQKLE
jgi:hypothetical protein